VKNLLKSVYVRIFRLFTISKFKKFGKSSYIGAHANIRYGKKMTIGNCVSIGRFCRMQCYKEFAGEKLNPEIVIQDGCYISDNFTVLSAARVELEKDVLIASNVTICSENHSINPEVATPYKNQPLTFASVMVGEGTWIGQNVVIMPGVRIGKKCVIGASAVVTKDVDDYCMVVGVPAKVIKKYDFDIGNWTKINR